MHQQGRTARQHDLLGSLLIGKSEIADLARVRRPVVTMWIARYRSRATPFPAPAEVRGDRELYRATEVADWISQRALGNNPDLREDLVAHAVLHRDSGEDAHPRLDRRNALAALLALRAGTGEPLAGRDANEILAAARQLDPEDRCLLGEVASLGDRLPALAEHADLLCDATYGPGPAYAALLRQVRTTGPDARPPLAGRVPALVGRLAAGLLAGEPFPSVLDTDPRDATLLLAIRDALPEDVTPDVALGDETAGSRAVRRHLLAAGVAVAGRDTDGAGRPGADLAIARLPELTAGSSPLAGMAGLAEHCRSMPEGCPGIVVGPSGLLTDRIADPAVDALRWDVVRGDRIRCVVRLPEGLVPSRPGVALALWVLGPPRGLTADERWMTIADLSAVHLEDSVTDALVTDVLASMGSFAEAGRHTFSHARIVRTASVIARGAMLPVPPPSVTPGRTVGAADTAVTIQLMADTIAERHTESPPSIRVQASTTPRTRLVPAGRLAADRRLRALPGTRIDPAHLDPAGAVAVIGPEEIHGRARVGDRRIDRLVFSTEYPRAGYTEPGDVVFCTTPRPGALVDHQGSHAVLAPARVLRISDPAGSGLVPGLVAAQLRRLVGKRKPAGSIRATAGWRTWLLPVLDTDVAPGIGAALDELDAHRGRLAEQLSAVDDLMQTLTAHLADGVVTAEPATARPGRARRRTGTR